MMHHLTRRAVFFTVSLVLAALATPCSAHFLWLKSINHDGKPHAYLHFGENVADEAYHFPEKLAKIKLWQRGADGQRAELKTTPLETDEQIGLISPLSDEQPCVLETTQQYGIYGAGLLVYYAKHPRASSDEELNAAGRSIELKLDIVPRIKGDELELTTLWDGKPLAGATVTISNGDDETIEKKSGDDGKVTVTLKSGGVIGVLANYVEEDASGDLDGKPYKSVMHYSSLTFNRKGAAKDAPSKKSEGNEQATEETTSATKKSAGNAPVPSLPEAISSFGGAVHDGWLYVYGGHTGKEHDHSAANLSQHFRRIQLDANGHASPGATWEELPMQTPLQGLPLVAHNGLIYRVGGLSARNATKKDKEDLHSVTEFASYNPQTRQWTAVAPLPAGRSSHDAVFIGNKLYVVGGWTLSGSRKGDWLDEVLVYDVEQPSDGWQKIKQPFRRRALAAGEWQGGLVALGGMDEEADISQSSNAFDTERKTWSKVADVPGEGMAGFGVSAWNTGGKLYVCGCEGVVYRLNDDGERWDEVARLARPRFFHRLLAAGPDKLLVVGGATSDGHIADVELIDVSGSAGVADNSKRKASL
jgi:hypothetical protein